MIVAAVVLTALLTAAGSVLFARVRARRAALQQEAEVAEIDAMVRRMKRDQGEPR